MLCSLLLACACAPVTDPGGPGAGEPDAGGGGGGSGGPHRLEVERSGEGVGLVISEPAGIDCGDTCEAEFDQGTTVSLTARATASSNFVGWTGACSGRDACAVELQRDEVVGAHFEPSATARWAQLYGASLADQFQHIAVDPDGNLVTAGVYYGSVSFGDYTLDGMNSPDGSRSADVFVAKFAPDGQVLWAKAIQGPGRDTPGGLAVDQLGDVYVAGDFSLGLSAPAVCPNAGVTDVFHYKLSGATGAREWHYCYGGTESDQVGDVAIDTAGVLWIAHMFKGTAGFGGKAGEISFASVGGDDIVVSRYTPEGEHLGSRHYGSAAGDDQLLDLAPHPDGGVAAAGYVSGDLPFDDAGAIESRGELDAVVLRFRPAGDVLWAKNWGGTRRDTGGRVAVAENGDLFLSASFAQGAPGMATFGGAEFANEDTSGDLVLARYAAVTGEHQWSFALAANGFAAIRGLTLDEDGHPIAAGFFAGSMDFGDGPLGGFETYSTFVAEFGAHEGAHRWSVSHGSAANQAILNAAAYSPSADALFVGGGFRGSLDFGDGPVASVSDEYDALLVRMVP